MTDYRINELLKKYDLSLRSLRPVSGGDINDSYQIRTHSGETWFLKVNRRGAPREIISTEYESLLLLKKYGVTNIPRSFELLEHGDTAGLLMEFYESPTSSPDWNQFYADLARMHRVSNDQFGGKDNFIGRLPQKNTKCTLWEEFFIKNRLEPQIQMGTDQGRLPSSASTKIDLLFEKVREICPTEAPSLIHGDLWGGNILTTPNTILIIDPCAHFGHREMDLAMMDLFGSFPQISSFESYNSIYPVEPGFENRKEMYQLYYLLVHLNIFGMGYYSQVERIITKFTG